MMNVPQIKSIWLDEDDETEKLYGLQAHQLLDSDDDDELGVVMINSDKPVLSNRKNINLPPLPPNAYDKQSGKKSFKKKKNSLLKLFQNKSSKEEPPKLKISVPFGFNHISHADSKAGFEMPTADSPPPSNSHLQDIPENTKFPTNSTINSPTQMTKAFVTDAIPYAKHHLVSRGSSTKRSSVGSSTYSNQRVTSTSTMATSLLNDSHMRSISKLTTLEKTHLKHKYSQSDASEVDVDFLKNYQFPTLLEEQSILQVSTPETGDKKIDKFQWETPVNSADLLETMLLDDLKSVPKKSITPKHSLKRNSDPILTPILRPSEYLDSPRTRRSVDDVLLCYLQPSDAGSSLDESSSEFSYARNSNIYYKSIL
ncbi:Gic2p [Kluyveromyces lactis]|uniref:KLLA0C14762p n=1 Tax=Kluyveromyces lactis (strain ATCC 8585 / CBS 2359 / DSM 70799 / NBRC 1267 / NRRL Y-1140 / WM37) TaxID=284590 RepID=Q6CT78_KLULA|nr:uncharacterized protein KLLA0_C14762g [Kluyveromyces lactis]CAH01712.1 KLLA0C14762p [Kluyveromyces lactis]|eukprot:XP_452861.1 uncharacterized protein KLLA0_C14762g [Kluyveromyces lactis]